MKLRFLMQLKETKLTAITMHGGANEGSFGHPFGLISDYVKKHHSPWQNQ